MKTETKEQEKMNEACENMKRIDKSQVGMKGITICEGYKYKDGKRVFSNLDIIRVKLEG
jgi:hypothetical protein